MSQDRVGRSLSWGRAPALLLEGIQVSTDLGKDAVHGAFGIDLPGEGHEGGEAGEGCTDAADARADLS